MTPMAGEPSFLEEQVKKKGFTIVFQDYIAIAMASNPRPTITGRARKMEDMKSFL